MSDEQYKETWFIVPSYIVDLPGLTLRSLKVYETIYQFWNKSRKCFLSNPEIERRTGVKVTQVKEAIAFFEKHGELDRIQIGMKRYLIQPIKAVEVPGLELVPKQVALNQATCTTVTQVALNQATGGLKSGQEVALNQATEIKNLNKESKKDKTPISPKRGLSLFCEFSLDEMLKDNPHNLTAEEITEWEGIRIKKHKAPMTARAWKRNNRVIAELVSKGLRVADVLDRMLSAKWQGAEVNYFDKEIAKANHTPIIKPVQDREMREQLKQQAIEREQREQAAKEKEKREAPQAMNTLKASGGYKEAQAKANKEMKELGMEPKEYYAYVHEKLNKARVSEDNLQSGD